MAAKAAPSALVVARRAADGGCGAGYGDPPFAFQRWAPRTTPQEATRQSPAPRWDMPSSTNSPRTMAGPPVGAASGTVGAAAAGEGGAACRHRVQNRPASRCSCAADGGTVVERHSVLCRALAEPVIEVPKILPDRVPQRIVERRPPQTAEQLVEVPIDPADALGALISSALGGGLQGSLPEQDSLRLQRAVEQLLNNPVPQGRRRRGGGLQGSRPGQNSTAADVEQIVDIPSRGGLPGFSPSPGPGR